MRAVTIDAPKVLRITEAPEPVPRAGQVVLAVDLVGVCGTDVHVVDGHFQAARYPVVPGHEVTGTVVAVGDGVGDLQVGDRVVVDPGLPCRTCLLCRRGRPNLCERRNAVGITLNGGAADRVAVPAVNCHVLPEGLPASAAVLTEPLACVLHALEQAPAPLGRRALVYGAGTIGLLALQVLRHLAVDSVDVVDINPDKLDVAAQLGADSTVAPDGLPDREDWDLVVDASGAPEAIADGLSRLQRGGVFLQVGVAPEEATVPLSPYRVFSREIAIVGSMTTRHTFPGALRLLAGGIIDTGKIVEAPVPLTHYDEAIARVRGGGALKVVVSPGLDETGAPRRLEG